MKPLLPEKITTNGTAHVKENWHSVTKLIITYMFNKNIIRLRPFSSS